MRRRWPIDRGRKRFFKLKAENNVLLDEMKLVKWNVTVNSSQKNITVENLSWNLSDKWECIWSMFGKIIM